VAGGWTGCAADGVMSGQNAGSGGRGVIGSVSSRKPLWRVEVRRCGSVGVYQPEYPLRLQCRRRMAKKRRLPNYVAENKETRKMNRQIIGMAEGGAIKKKKKKKKKKKRPSGSRAHRRGAVVKRMGDSVVACGGGIAIAWRNAAKCPAASSNKHHARKTSGMTAAEQTLCYSFRGCIPLYSSCAIPLYGIGKWRAGGMAWPAFTSDMLYLSRYGRRGRHYEHAGAKSGEAVFI